MRKALIVGIVLAVLGYCVTTSRAGRAASLERVLPDELAAIGSRRAEVRVFFDSLYRMPGPDATGMLPRD